MTNSQPEEAYLLTCVACDSPSPWWHRLDVRVLNVDHLARDLVRLVVTIHATVATLI